MNCNYCNNGYATAGYMTPYPAFALDAYDKQAKIQRDRLAQHPAPINPRMPSLHSPPKMPYYKYGSNQCNTHSNRQPIDFPDVGPTYGIYVNQALPPHAP